MNTVLRDEWGFRGMALTDFFRNNGHGFMNADAALANGVDVMLSHIQWRREQCSQSGASNICTSDEKCLQKCHVYSCKQLGL